MKSRIATLLTAALGAAACLSLGAVAHAYPDAKVEAQTRPDFGLLIRPPLHRHHYRPWGGHRPGFYVDEGYGRFGPDGGPNPYGPGGGREVAFVDCGKAHPGEVNWALRSLRPGGTLILRAGHVDGGACLDNVVVDKPVTIQGDGGAPYRSIRLGYESPGGQHRTKREIIDETVSIPAALKSRPGGPCIDIEVQAGLTGEVVLRDLVIEDTDAGDESCVYVRDSHVRLERSVIRYAGNGSALYVNGGSVTATDDVRVDANTFGSGIYVENGFVDFDEVTVTRAATGIQIEPTGKQPSRIRNSRLFLWPAQSPSFGTSSTGIVVPGSREQGQLAIENTVICGYGIGLFVEGANTVELNDSRICHVAKGAVAAGGQLTVKGSAIGANLLGIQIGAGKVAVSGTKFYGMRYREIYLEPGATEAQLSNVDYYTNSEYCRWRPVDDGFWRERGRRERHGGGFFGFGRHDDMHDRFYNPHAYGPSGRCFEPNPGDWADEEDFGFEGNNEFYGFNGDSGWPAYERRVPEPYDHYDWDHPDTYRPHRDHY